MNISGEFSKLSSSNNNYTCEYMKLLIFIIIINCGL